MCPASRKRGIGAGHSVPFVLTRMKIRISDACRASRNRGTGEGDSKSGSSSKAVNLYSPSPGARRTPDTTKENASTLPAITFSRPKCQAQALMGPSLRWASTRYIEVVALMLSDLAGRRGWSP